MQCGTRPQDPVAIGTADAVPRLQAFAAAPTDAAPLVEELAAKLPVRAAPERNCGLDAHRLAGAEPALRDPVAEADLRTGGLR
jgi:hypothetical protein